MECGWFLYPTWLLVVIFPLYPPLCCQVFYPVCSIPFPSSVVHLVMRNPTLKYALGKVVTGASAKQGFMGVAKISAGKQNPQAPLHREK